MVEAVPFYAQEPGLQRGALDDGFVAGQQREVLVAVAGDTEPGAVAAACVYR